MLGGRLLIQRIGKGTLCRNREALAILDTQFLTLLYKPVNMIVCTAGAEKHIVVQFQVKAGTVAHKHVAVTIQYIATGSFHPGIGGKGALVIGVTVRVQDLHIIQFETIEHHNQQKTDNHKKRPSADYSLHISPPIACIRKNTGYKTGTASTLPSAVTRKPRTL